jgi:hypothetical protein
MSRGSNFLQLIFGRTIAFEEEITKSLRKGRMFADERLSGMLCAFCPEGSRAFLIGIPTNTQNLEAKKMIIRRRT